MVRHAKAKAKGTRQNFRIVHGSHLYLLLDSLDEAMLRVETIAHLLADGLQNLPIQRMSIIALFNNTTAASSVQQDDTVKAERSHYFDLGISQVIVPGLTVGLDGYYKLATNLIDEGQFGAPIIFSAFTPKPVSAARNSP